MNNQAGTSKSPIAHTSNSLVNVNNNEFLHGTYQQSFRPETPLEYNAYGRPNEHDYNGNYFPKETHSLPTEVYEEMDTEDIFRHAEEDAFHYNQL